MTIYFQNFTKDNKTQGIMEKSQWDLKQIRFQRRRLTRRDDFVTAYQNTHIALLREFADVESTRRRVCLKIHYTFIIYQKCNGAILNTTKY